MISQWTMDCTEERKLPRFRDSVRTTQHSADAEVIASQKQKDTLNTFKSFFTRTKGQTDKQLLEKNMLEDNEQW